MVAIDPAIFYSPNYDIHFWGIERMHPFDSRKYSRAFKTLLAEFGERLTVRTTAPRQPTTREQLLAVHSSTYLDRLRSPAYVAQVVELPILARLPRPMLEMRLLKPMRLGVAGTVLAAQRALKCGIAVNLAGGYHHCSEDRGEGFTIYSDIALAIHTLRHEGRLGPDERALIIDLDAHQGNGHERLFFSDHSVYIFDMYNQFIYPRDAVARQRIDCNIPLQVGCTGETYLEQLREALPTALKAAGRVGFAIYIAGTDVYNRDLLGMMQLSEADVLARDVFVFDSLVAADIPFVMVLGGGYSRDSYRLIANSVAYLLRKFGT